MPNSFEQSPEHIPSGQEVMEVMRHVDNAAAYVREKSDELGPYYLEAKAEGDKPGTFTEYIYQRKGVFANGQESATTVVYRIYYEDDMPSPSGSTTVAEYDSTSNEWREIH